MIFNFFFLIFSLLVSIYILSIDQLSNSLIYSSVVSCLLLSIPSELFDSGLHFFSARISIQFSFHRFHFFAEMSNSFTHVAQLFH